MNRIVYLSAMIACLVALVVARSAVAGAPAAGESLSISIDATQTGEPMSEYVYSQFIEHLGRCIYGGIWAEMLEDRKFYYPVTDNYSPYGRGGRRGGGMAFGARRGGAAPGPEATILFRAIAASPWEVIGEAGTVTMVEEDSFVGDHTPQVAAASGIRQRELGVLAGKEYTGYVWLKPVEASAEVEVTLRWGEGEGDAASTEIAVSGTEYSKSAFRFTAGAATDEAMLEIRVSGGPCLVGTASLMPADNIDGMRADTIALLKQLDAPLYRWPGGNFVSGYNWEDGIGPRDRRPPRKNPAWTGVEHNDMGLHEFANFCRVLDTEAEVVVNSGLGGLEMALAELEYCNGSADTPMGKRRAANGHPQPFNVEWWAVGNEMWGDFQLGHMPLSDYIKKHNDFAGAMMEADPSIKIIAVGRVGEWDEGMMPGCADYMDLVSEHFYVQERPGNLIAHVRLVPNEIARISNAHRDYRERFEELQGKDIRISMDEWNYWYGPHVFGELGTRYFLKDGLGIAAGVHEFSRQSDMVFMANYAQTVNVIGFIKTNKTAACLDSTGMALKLYRQHFGVVPVEVTASQPLDVAAAWSEDRKNLTIGVVNPTMEKQDITLSVTGAKLTGAGQRWQIAGDDPQAYNDPGKEPMVDIEQAAVTGANKTLSVDPCSATVFVLPVE